MSSRIRSRSLCSRLSRQGFPCSWCGLGAVLLFVMAYPPVAETSSEEIPVLFSTTSQEHTPFTFLQESGQNRCDVREFLLGRPGQACGCHGERNLLCLRPAASRNQCDVSLGHVCRSHLQQVLRLRLGYAEWLN